MDDIVEKPTLTGENFKEFLETAPIYAYKEFAAEQIENHIMNRRSEHSLKRSYSFRVKEIDDFCEVCEKIRPFGCWGEAISFTIPEQFLVSFNCITCGEESRRYFISSIGDDKVVKLQKIGEYPRKKLSRDKRLQKFFNKDIENYEKAIACLANGYGIGAFVYWRRIVEDNIYQLLDLLKEEIASLEGDEKTEAEAAISRLKEKTPMQDKIELANKVLPSYLKINGINPLKQIYSLLSEGVHIFSEEECLKKAALVQEYLKFLISELATRRESRRRIIEMTGKL